MTTPSGVEIIALGPNGSINITEGVQVLYDHLIHSMEWCSDFLSVEDVIPIVDLAKICGFKDFEVAEEYVEKEKVKERQRQCNHHEWIEAADQKYEGYIRFICNSCGLARYERQEKATST